MIIERLWVYGALLLSILGAAEMSQAAVVEYAVEGRAWIADRWENNGVWELDGTYANFSGTFMINDEGLLHDNGSSQMSQFAIESFSLYSIELDLSWAGTGIFVFFDYHNHDLGGDGYMDLWGNTSQGVTWGKYSALQQSSIEDVPSTNFGSIGFTVGWDDGADEMYYVAGDANNPVHICNFSFDLTPAVPVPEPLTFYLLTAGLVGHVLSRTLISEHRGRLYYGMFEK